MTRVVLFSLFFCALSTLFGLVQWYVFSSCKKWLTRTFDFRQYLFWRRALLWLLFLINFLFVLSFILRWFEIHNAAWLSYAVFYPNGLLFGSIVLTFLILLTKDLVKLIYFTSYSAYSFAAKLIRRNRANPIDHFSPRRRAFLKAGGVLTASSALGLPFIGALTTSRDYRIVRLPLFYPELPVGLEGLSIAQVSDIHAGVFMPQSSISEIFEIVNSLDPHMIMLTGDFVDVSDREIPSIYDTIGELRAEYGIFGCLGNHDHFATASRVTDALEQRGVEMLNNRHKTVNLNGSRISVIGVDDAGSAGQRRDFSDIDTALLNLPANSFRILLTHRPIFKWAKTHELDLTLAGHTHGGQVGFEFGGLRLNPVYLFYEYAKGLYQEAGRSIYVNSGVGMVGVPIRLVPPEITLFTLTGRRPKAG